MSEGMKKDIPWNENQERTEITVSDKTKLK